jgi:hypothetical protein
VPADLNWCVVSQANAINPAGVDWRQLNVPYDGETERMIMDGRG